MVLHIFHLASFSFFSYQIHIGLDTVSPFSIKLLMVCSNSMFLVATKRLYMSVCPSVGWSVGRLVTLSLFGLLGATNAVHTAPLLVFDRKEYL